MNADGASRQPVESMERCGRLRAAEQGNWLCKSLSFLVGVTGTCHTYVPNVSNAVQVLAKAFPCAESVAGRCSAARGRRSRGLACVDRALISPYARHMLPTTWD